MGFSSAYSKKVPSLAARVHICEFHTRRYGAAYNGHKRFLGMGLSLGSATWSCPPVHPPTRATLLRHNASTGTVGQIVLFAKVYVHAQGTNNTLTRPPSVT